MPAYTSPFRIGFVALLAQSFLTFGAIRVSETGEIFFLANTSVRYDDNLFQTDLNRVDDVVFQFSPGIEFRAGTTGSALYSLGYTHNFLVYADNNDRNSNLASLNGAMSIETARSSLSLSGFYQQLEGNNSDFLGSLFGDLIRRDIYGVTGRAETAITPKVSASAGASFRTTDYQNPLLSDQTVISLPLNVYYKFTPKVDLSTGYEFRTTDQTLGPDTNSHFINVGARGEILPKLTSNIRVGVENRESSGALASRSILAVDGTLSWAASPKSTYGLELGRRFDTSGQGGGLSRTSASVFGRFQFTPQLSGNAQISYEMSDYDNVNRTDNYYEFNVGGTYVVNNVVSLSAGYIHRFNSSDVAAVEFSNNIVSISALFRF
jgi:hypothetical protein